jgi:hypothetical protein
MVVIGNASYKTQPLRNPVNDARAMSKKLRSFGFDVIERINVNKKQMQASIINFGKKLGGRCCDFEDGLRTLPPNTGDRAALGGGCALENQFFGSTGECIVLVPARL